MITKTFGKATRKEIKERSPEKYDMELNKTDMLTILKALETEFYENANGNAFGLRTSIMDTIGIEEI